MSAKQKTPNVTSCIRFPDYPPAWKTDKNMKPKNFLAPIVEKDMFQKTVCEDMQEYMLTYNNN